MLLDVRSWKFLSGPIGEGTKLFIPFSISRKGIKFYSMLYRFVVLCTHMLFDEDFHFFGIG